MVGLLALFVRVLFCSETGFGSLPASVFQVGWWAGATIPEGWVLILIFFSFKGHFSANLWDSSKFTVAVLLRCNYSEDLCIAQDITMTFWLCLVNTRFLFVVILHSTSSVSFIDFHFFSKTDGDSMEIFEHPSLLNLSWPKNSPFFSNLISLLFILPGEH